jgi:hypothetical protein
VSIAPRTKPTIRVEITKPTHVGVRLIATRPIRLRRAPIKQYQPTPVTATIRPLQKLAKKPPTVVAKSKMPSDSRLRPKVSCICSQATPKAPPCMPIAMKLRQPIARRDIRNRGLIGGCIRNSLPAYSRDNISI